MQAINAIREGDPQDQTHAFPKCRGCSTPQTGFYRSLGDPKLDSFPSEIPILLKESHTRERNANLSVSSLVYCIMTGSHNSVVLGV